MDGREIAPGLTIFGTKKKPKGEKSQKEINSVLDSIYSVLVILSESSSNKDLVKEELYKIGKLLGKI